MGAARPYCRRFARALLVGVIGCLLLGQAAGRHVLVLQAQNRPSRTLAFVNGRWFTGQAFETRTVYAIDGRFASMKPAVVDDTLDLTGTYVVPPFAEAHNHNIGRREEDDRPDIRKYLLDGVFYVMIQGNIPLTVAEIERYGLNQPGGLDVALAQGSLTAPGAHPQQVVEAALGRGGFGTAYTKESLRDFRYFPIDSEAELTQKWPRIVALRPDFIKLFLHFSDQYEQLKDDPAVFMKGLNPQLVPAIVGRAHAQKLRVSAHTANVADFQTAVAAGVDIIAHLPRFISGTPVRPIEVADAKAAAQRGVAVITTLAVGMGPRIVNPADLPRARATTISDLKILHANGVRIAVGSDNVSDTSVAEATFLHALGAFDPATLLRIWTETTPTVIFPDRKIGALREGYEASFLALEGNPLDDFANVRRIKYAVKQGIRLPR
jgi:imidazolonepropionase-like amidohydrolase